MSENVEGAAQRIAQRGREQLLGHLRPAFQQAAAAHADLLELTAEQLEEMVQRAVERADGLQWRRALASAACEELHISLSEALDHPAVARAQELVGAPSYEESLAQLVASADDAPAPARTRPPERGTPEPAAEEISAHAETADEQPVQHAEPADEQPVPDAEPADDQPVPDAEPAPVDESREEEWRDAAQERDEEYEEPDEADWVEEDLPQLRIPVIHVGGIANLGPAEGGIELLLAEPGLDIVRGGGEVLGRLEWDQVQTLEVPPPRRRRRRAAGAQLVIRTARGEASFQAPEHSADDLRAQISPILELYLSG